MRHHHEKSRNSSDFYDEVRFLGKARPTYAQFITSRARVERGEIQRFSRAAKRVFHGDADVLDVPMIFSERDYQLLSRGTLQRGKAIHSFLFDHYFGGKKYLQYPLMRSLPLQDILKRSHETEIQEFLRPDALQFWYAPDVIRDSRGRFRVIEDNTGFIGGFGDLEASAHAASILSARKSRPPAGSPFYRELIQYYQTQANKFGGGKIILISYDPKIRVTHEDQRLAAGLLPLGVEHVTRLKSLTLNQQGLFHRGERVGFVILNRDTADIDPLDDRIIERYLANGITELQVPQRKPFSKLLKKSTLHMLHRKLANLGGVNVSSPETVEQVAGFWLSARSGLFGVSYVPGLEFINDKEFYPCVELLIHIYLQETPLLKNIPTVSLRKKPTFDLVFANIEKWVIKGINGRGGEEVWIGKKLKSRELKSLQARVQKDRSRYVAQQYIELSRIEDHSVDMRALSMIAGDRQIVSHIPWGRAIPISTSGKVNISNGGLVTATQVLSEEATWK